MMTKMVHVVLYQPEIPANTGNIIRLCANCGAELHLIEPLGFELDDKKLRRAGLDYHEFAELKVWPDWSEYQNAHPERRWVCVETTGAQAHSDFAFRADDALIFGSETQGLPTAIMSAENTHSVYLPMKSTSRSLNLSNCVAVAVYEAWRQLGYTR